MQKDTYLHREPVYLSVLSLLVSKISGDRLVHLHTVYSFPWVQYKIQCFHWVQYRFGAFTRFNTRFNVFTVLKIGLSSTFNEFSAGFNASTGFGTLYEFKDLLTIRHVRHGQQFKKKNNLLIKFTSRPGCIHQETYKQTQVHMGYDRMLQDRVLVFSYKS